MKMLINDTSTLTKATIDKLNVSRFIHINTDSQPLTEASTLELLEIFNDKDML